MSYTQKFCALLMSDYSPLKMGKIVDKHNALDACLIWTKLTRLQHIHQKQNDQKTAEYIHYSSPTSIYKYHKTASDCLNKQSFSFH